MTRWLACLRSKVATTVDGNQVGHAPATSAAARAVPCSEASSLKSAAFQGFTSGAGDPNQSAAQEAVDTTRAVAGQLAAILQLNVDASKLPGATVPADESCSPSCTKGFPVGLDEYNSLFSPASSHTDDPLEEAALLGKGGMLPTVSMASLQAAFCGSMRAIAVVRVVRAAGCSDGGSSSSTGEDTPANTASPMTPMHKRSSYSSVNGVPFEAFLSQPGSVSIAVRNKHEDSSVVQLVSSPGCHSVRFSAFDEIQAPPAMCSCTGSTRGTADATSAGLEPVFLNCAVKRMLEVRNAEEYTFVIDKQLSRNPMLAMLFVNCIQRLLAGKAASVRQYTPIFSSVNSVHASAQATFIHLQIDACLFEDPGSQPCPALCLWFNAPSSQFDLLSQLKRNQMALAAVPSMVTVMAMDGRVLHQNSSSVSYMGFAMARSKYEGTSIGDRSHSLQRLFALEPAALEDMLNALVDGKTWQGLVKMHAQMDLSDDCEGFGDVLPTVRPTDSTPGQALPHLQHCRQSSDTFRNAVLAPARPRCSTSSSAIPLCRGAPADVQSSGGSFSAAKWEKSRASLCTQLGNSRAMRMLKPFAVHKPHVDTPGTEHRNSDPERSALGGPGAYSWHTVQANKFSDPVTGEDVIMLIQTDVTSRVTAEQQLQQLLNAEHGLLEGIFPKQVLQTLTRAAISMSGSGTASAKVSASGVAGDQGVDGLSPKLRLAANKRIKVPLEHEQVSILFADIVGFTSMSKEVEPGVVMDFLNDLYTRFDDLVEEAGVYKVETIGDCYMVAGGLIFTDQQGFKSVLESQVDPLHAHRTFAFALAMLAAASGVVMPDSGEPVKLRVGIHSGPVVSGVVGTRMPRFCLFGDSVNTASRMESSNSHPNTVHVSADTHALIGGDFWQSLGGTRVKGKGHMETYYFDPAAPLTPDHEGQLQALLSRVKGEAPSISNQGSRRNSVSVAGSSAETHTGSALALQHLASLSAGTVFDEMDSWLHS